jgi:dihydroorotate dehydrogenase
MIDSIGFGFESIGTVTNHPYKGNPYPRIKRFVNSRAILVNKGFKSRGIDATLSSLEGARFRIPIGISIGRTNDAKLDTYEASIADIVATFQKVKASTVPFAYYELNISCPNLIVDISFNEPSRLETLLTAVEAVGLEKPLFIKMPISQPDAVITAMLDVIARHRIAAVVFGNLQHDRNDPALDRGDAKASRDLRGHWAGMPCQRRSDETVRLAFEHTRGTLPIIGCGGIFTAQDAYRKIRLGASLVQLAASTIYEGPQVAAEIAIGLSELLEKDGFAHIADAVGVDVRVDKMPTSALTVTGSVRA